MPDESEQHISLPKTETERPVSQLAKVLPQVRPKSLTNGSQTPTGQADTAPTGAVQDSDSTLHPLVTNVVINPQLLSAAGIRKLDGTHITLYTDLPDHPSINQLPSIFDKAVPEWCRYFQVDIQKTAAWHLHGYLIENKERFITAGLFPDDLPPFLHGFQRGSEIWFYEQKSDYYRRHLLLHEGTHAFMNRFLGSGGPPWYSEGLAELLGTHHWEEARLALCHFPQHRDEVPYWGRIKIIQEDVAHSGFRGLKQLLDTNALAYLKVNPYAWSWAVTAFLDGHPAYRQRFRTLQKHVADPLFSQHLLNSFRTDWDQLEEEWQLFVMNLVYGYDIASEAVIFRSGKSLTKQPTTVVVRTDRGWQSSGVQLETGVSYSLQASGRYQLANELQPWWCEPNGVTIRYHQGEPLGILLGVIRPEHQGTGLTQLAQPKVLGSQQTLTSQVTGTLYLRINDSPAELADNLGEVNVKIQRMTSNETPTSETLN